MVSRLNAQFLAGRPSDTLDEAGVLVRQIDALVDHEGTAPWEVTFYTHLRDRLAASIVNAKLPFMFSTSAVGFVLSTSKLQEALWCSYPRDGNSMSAADHGCASKGAIGSFKSLERMLIYHGNHLAPTRSCLWGKPDVDDRSNCRYNEVVLKSDVYAAQLPGVVEAVFFPEHGPVHHPEGDEVRARGVHRAFINAFMLNGDRRVPLLAYDVEEARFGRAPFREVVR